MNRIVALIISVLTLAYSETYPKLLWTQTENGTPYGYVSLVSVKSIVDSQNNLYVTGYAQSDTSYDDIFIIKYASDGAQKWIKFYNIYNVTCRPYSISVDTSLNVYITGHTYNNSTCVSSNLTIKYDINGNLDWLSNYENSLSFINSDICVDDSGNVYLLCCSYDSTNQVRKMIIKYDLNGHLKWNIYSDFGTGINSIRIMDSSKIICHFGNTIFKYNSLGQKLWESHKDTLNDNIIMKIDAADNIYLLGCWINPQVALIKYSSAGLLLWTTIIDSINSNESISLDVDSSGNSYISGTAAYSWKGTAIKVGTNGNVIWRNSYIDYGANEYCPESICYDKDGSVFVVGTSRFSGGRKIIILMYDSTGVQSGTVRIDNLLVDPVLLTKNRSYLYLISNEYISSYIYQVNIMCFDQYGSDILSPVEIPGIFILYPNYPNPFNSSTGIRYEIQRPGNVKIKILDILGKSIETIENTYKESGRYLVHWNATKYSSGIYFIQIEVDNSSQSMKCLLLK